MKDEKRYTALNHITNEFLDFINSKGYMIEQPVNITSKIDPSVRFIGAPISILKPYFLNKNIPDTGIAMKQNCIRTQNQKILYEPSILPNWGSFFTGMCILVRYSDLCRICLDAIELLTKYFKIDINDINININKKDGDLFNAIKMTALGHNQILFNKKPDKYYTHKYGIEEVSGRNFNFSIRNCRTGEFNDIGNIIIIESSSGEKLGVELALGDTTIIKQKYGLNHVLDAYCLGLDFIKNSNIRYRIEDAIITAIVLLNEGLKPNGGETRGRILKSYIKSISLYSYLIGIKDDVLFNVIKTTEAEKLPIICHNIASELMAYILKYRNSMLANPVGKENEKISSLLKNDLYKLPEIL